MITISSILENMNLILIRPLARVSGRCSWLEKQLLKMLMFPHPRRVLQSKLLDKVRQLQYQHLNQGHW
jgi:hypothetical protein